jgi:ATP-dependent Lhr-like helicase
MQRLTNEHRLDERAANNLLTFLNEQAAATGTVPSDRTVVVERFRDEIGDWRLCILTPFGARVHAPWALALAARFRESLGLEVQSIWSDDGIALHLPDADTPPPTDAIVISPEEIEELVVQEVGQSALFGARFRENAARALLIPRRRPDQRTPLWQQRLKAQGLLQVARRYGSFPIILETYRECLQDVFDLPALKGLLQGLRTRELDLVDVETASASPYSASLLFDYIATYMYEDDTPPAERRAQALSLDRDLLRELLGQEELRDLLDADALEEVEAQLRGNPRNADQLHDQLRLRGDLCEGEYDEGFAQTLLRERRALLVRFAGDQRLIAAEDAGRYRDALGVMPPGGLPEVFLEGGPESLEQLVLRYARGRGPFTTAQANESFGRDVQSLLQQFERQEKLLRGSAGSCPTGTGSTAARRYVKRLCRCRDSRCPSCCGSPMCCLGAFQGSIRVSSTSFALRARSCGWGQASTGSPSSSARTRRHSAVPPQHRRRKARSTTGSATRSDAAQSSGTTS